MTILTAFYIVWLLYILNIVFVGFLGLRPYWMIYVPGLPLLKCLLVICSIICMILMAALAGFLIGIGIIFYALWNLPLLWQKDEPPQVEEAYVEPELRVI